MISDLTTNAIVPELAAFTEVACKKLRVPRARVSIGGRTYDLPTNPTQHPVAPLLLVPTDILRPLPVASDWSEVANAASHNATLRRTVSRLIGDIWAAQTRRDMQRLRRRALESRESFESLLEVLKGAKPKAYDQQRDPDGLFVWREIRARIAERFPLKLELGGEPGPPTAIALVRRIIDHFGVLVEKKGVWRVLWHEDKPRSEKTAQMVFFAVADAYCRANNLDVTPEADTGAGPVDFKFSAGYAVRVLVEVKLSRNENLVHGYETQLRTYAGAETPIHAFYLVLQIDPAIGRLRRLKAVKKALSAAGQPAPEIVVVDGTRKLSASRQR